MTSHDLARMLLDMEDLPVSLYVNGHSYDSECHENSHGSVKIQRVQTYKGLHMRIGNLKIMEADKNE